MLYSEQLTYYRNQFRRYLDARDSTNAKLYAILYAKLVREILGQSNSYIDRVSLTAEANKYDVFAAMITKYGITDDVKKRILHGETAVSSPQPSADAKTPPKPVAPKSDPKPVAVKNDPKPAAPRSDPKPAAAKIEPKPAVPKSNPKLVPPPPMPPPVASSAQTPPPPMRNDASGEDLDWCADIFEKYSAATLEIKTSTGAGTGFFITSDGYLLTNHHVVHEGSTRETYIKVSNGNKTITGNAEIVNADKHHDVALLKLKNCSSKIPFIPIIKDYSRVRPGIAMVLIGNGLDFGLAPIAGNVKFPCSNVNGNLVYTAPSNPGDSGAPVFNREGECIGINKSSTVGVTIGFSKRVDTVGLANGTTAENIRKLLSKWGLEGKV